MINIPYDPAVMCGHTVEGIFWNTLRHVDDLPDDEALALCLSDMRKENTHYMVRPRHGFRFMMLEGRLA